MKKVISITLILVLCLSLIGCGQTEDIQKDYTLDKDVLTDSLYDITVEGDREAFTNTYAVTDETYNALVGSIVSADLINDYIVFLPETDFTNYILFAFQTDNGDEVTALVDAYMADFVATKWLPDGYETSFVEGDWYVWCISLDDASVQEIFQNETDADALTAQLTELKETLAIFEMNMPSTLEDEYFTFEGMMEKDALVDMYVLNSTIIGVNPLMIFKPAEGCEDTVKDAISAWQQSQLDTMGWYQPNLVPIIEGMQLIEENGYLIYIINDYPTETLEAIASAWVEITN